MTRSAPDPSRRGDRKCFGSRAGVVGKAFWAQARVVGKVLARARVVKLWMKLRARMNSRRSPTSRRTLADLSALADGSLEPERREAVSREIAASPELSELFGREQHAVELLAHARESDRAPLALRERIAADRRTRTAPARRTRSRFVPGAALAAASVVAVLVATLAGGTAGSPSLADAAALAVRGANSPAPAPGPGPGQALDRSVGEVYFPDWGRTLGWHATGQRADRLDGHRAVTVYYARGTQTVAYTIVSAPALAQPSAVPVRLEGLELRALRLGGRVVVTWRRAGRTCVLSSRAVPAAALERMATWEPAGGGD